jgi:hypothetical protein
MKPGFRSTEGRASKKNEEAAERPTSFLLSFGFEHR